MLAQAQEEEARQLDGELPLPSPYLLFLGDTVDPSYAKTAFGLRDWAADRVVGEFALPSAGVTLDLPRLRPADAYAVGARALVIGVANSGGFVDPSWLPALEEALEHGLDIVSGLHTRLESVPELKRAADRNGRRLINVRTPVKGMKVGDGLKRSGKRLLTVGTDCALGKKYSALAIARAFQDRGVDADFRATGQTGIMISGGGVPMDAVVADFAAGAAEGLSPAADPTHWDVIEGQGSILHPSFAGVSLALLHGSQPDVFVVCHHPTRSRMVGSEGFAVPDVEEIVDLTIRLGRRTNPAIRWGGVCLNTAGMEEQEAARTLAAARERLGVPVADPMRGGAPFEELIDECLK